MRLSTITIVVLLILSSNTYAQDNIGRAHELFTQFWSNALHTNKNDTAEKEQTRKRAIELPREMEDPLTHGILDYLNGAQHPSASVLQASLAKALTAPMMGDQTAEGVADVVSTIDKNAYFVAYGVNYCITCSSTWFGEFTRKNGGFILNSYTREAGADQTVHVALIAPGTTPEIVLLYGVHLGDAHNRLNVRAYKFDANQLRLIWSLLDQPEGVIAIHERQITITSFTTLTPPFYQRQQVFDVTEDQVKLRRTFVSKTPEP